MNFTLTNSVFVKSDSEYLKLKFITQVQNEH